MVPLCEREAALFGGIAVALLLLILLLARCFGSEDKPNYATREVRRGPELAKLRAGDTGS